MINLRISAAAFVGIMALGTAASAATCSIGSGGNSLTAGADPVFATGSNGTGVECYNGNDTNTVDSNFTLFGDDGWILADKNDDNSSGDGELSFATAPTNGTKSGGFTIDNPNGIALENILLSLKAGNFFVMADISSLSGTWTSSKDLSHASIYYREGDDLPPIPLPAAGWMLLAGLGGFAAMRRRQTAS